MNTAKTEAFLRKQRRREKRDEKAIEQWLNKEDTTEARRIERFFTEGRKLVESLPRTPPPGGFKSIFDML